MPVIIQKGVRPVVPAKLTAERIRDALLSLPEGERVFIVSDPQVGEDKVFSIVREVGTGRVTLSCNKP